MTQVLCWDYKSLQLLPNTNCKKPFWDNIIGSPWDIWEWQCSLQEIDAFAASTANASVGSRRSSSVGAILWSICKLFPLLEDLLKPNNLSDLVRLLWIHQVLVCSFKERTSCDYFSLSLLSSNARLLNLCESQVSGGARI